MSGELQHLTILIYLLCIEITLSNSRTSTLWKLNTDKTRIIEATNFQQISNGAQQFITEDDPLFNIITSTEHLGQMWIKQGVQYYCTNCHHLKNNAE